MADRYQDRAELLSILGHAESVLQGHRSYAYTVLSLIGASELVLIADISNKDGWFKDGDWAPIIMAKIAVLLVLAVYNFWSIQRFRKNIYRFNFRVSVVEILLSAVSAPGWPLIQKKFKLAFDLGLFNIFRLILNRFNFESQFSFVSWFFNPYRTQKAVFDDCESHTFGKNNDERMRFKLPGLTDEKRKMIQETFHEFIAELGLIAKSGENIVWKSQSDDFLGNIIFRMFSLLAFNSVLFVAFFTFRLLGFNYSLCALDILPYTIVVALIFPLFALLPIFKSHKK
jgi:hypothetical protein